MKKIFALAVKKMKMLKKSMDDQSPISDDVLYYHSPYMTYPPIF